MIQHPQIIARKCKETHYFNEPINYEQGFSWYLTRFPNKFKKGNRQCFEATPNYLSNPKVPQLIKQDLGELKMIAILRNPVDRAYSAWKMCHSFGTNPNIHKALKRKADYRTFSEAINQELNEKSSFRDSKNVFRFDYIDKGKYVDHLQNYYNYFKKESYLSFKF